METWNPRRTVVWLTVLLPLAAVAGLYWASLARRPVGSVVDQIRAVMLRGERAVEERDVSDAMALVSRTYRDDYGFRYERLRALVWRQMREAESIQVTIPERLLQVRVDPDRKHAVVTARVDVRVESRYDTTHEVAANLTFHFAKEPVRYYLMFPGEEWRLVKLEGWQALAEE